MEKSTRTFTVETRLTPSQVASADNTLCAYAELFSRAERTMLARRNRGETIRKPAFQAEFGLNARMFNAVKNSLDGKIQSQLSNLKNYIQDDKQRISDLSKHITSLEKRRDNASSDALRASLQFKLDGKRQRLQSVRSRLTQRQQQLKEKKAHICFGSRKLFHAQHHLEDNGYTSHAEWASDWRVARASGIFIKGAKSEPFGCRNAQLQRQADDCFSLTLNLPPALHDSHGKTLCLTDLAFPRPQARAQLNRVLACWEQRVSQRADYRQQKKAGALTPNADGQLPTEDQALAEFGQALSFRFKRDKKGWRILVSFSYQVAQIVTSPRHGCVAIDINYVFLSLVETNASGHLVTAYDLPLPRDNVSSRHYLNQLQEAAKMIVAHCVRVNKPLIIEQLDFKKKKRGLISGQVTYNRMLSSFAYARISNALAARAHKDGVRIDEVDPAYTSLIGLLKYRHRSGGSTHTGAAWAIARRGQGRVDTVSSLPVISRIATRSGPVTYRQPADCAAFNEVAKALKAQVTEQSRRNRAASRQWRLGLPYSAAKAARIDAPF